MRSDAKPVAPQRQSECSQMSPVIIATLKALRSPAGTTLNLTSTFLQPSCLQSHWGPGRPIVSQTPCPHQFTPRGMRASAPVRVGGQSQGGNPGPQLPARGSGFHNIPKASGAVLPPPRCILVFYVWVPPCSFISLTHQRQLRVQDREACFESSYH